MSSLSLLMNAVRVRVYRLASALNDRARAAVRALAEGVRSVPARVVVSSVVEAVAEVASVPVVRTAVKAGAVVVGLGVGVWTVPGAVVAAVVALAKLVLLLVALEVWLRWSAGSQPAALRRAFRAATAAGLLWAAAGLFTLANAVAPSAQAPAPAAPPAGVVGAFTPGVFDSQTTPPFDPGSGRAGRKARGRAAARNGLA